MIHIFANQIYESYIIIQIFFYKIDKLHINFLKLLIVNSI